MSAAPLDPHAEITLRELYPDLSEAELQDAEDRLDQYLALAFRIWTRIESDPQARANFAALTAAEPHPTIELERSYPKPPEKP